MTHPEQYNVWTLPRQYDPSSHSKLYDISPGSMAHLKIVHCITHSQVVWHLQAVQCMNHIQVVWPIPICYDAFPGCALYVSFHDSITHSKIALHIQSIYSHIKLISLLSENKWMDRCTPNEPLVDTMSIKRLVCVAGSKMTNCVPVCFWKCLREGFLISLAKR